MRMAVCDDNEQFLLQMEQQPCGLPEKHEIKSFTGESQKGDRRATGSGSSSADAPRKQQRHHRTVRGHKAPFE